MTVEFKDNRYFTHIWFLEGESMNWMAAVWKDPDDVWMAQYRFRYFVDDKTHDSKDKKSWYTVKANDSSDATRDKLNDAMDFMAKLTANHYSTVVCRLDLNTSDNAVIMREFSAQRWADVREATPEEMAEHQEKT